MMLIAGYTALLTLLSVGLHYEALRYTSTWVAKARMPSRLRVAVAVLLALVAHLLEVLVFAAGWALLLRGTVPVLEPSPLGFSDTLYFSLISYTSLGYGDIVPLGDARILAGVQSLVGLVLIAWTASFTFFEMRRHWSE